MMSYSADNFNIDTYEEVVLKGPGRDSSVVMLAAHTDERRFRGHQGGDKVRSVPVVLKDSG
jgi:hypothetical protein